MSSELQAGKANSPCGTDVLREGLAAGVNDTNVIAYSKNEWKSCTLGDVVEVSQGLAINSKTKHFISEAGLPLLRITDMFKDEYAQFIAKDLAPAKCIASSEEIIYTRTGQVGYVFTNKIGVVHNNCFKVIPKTDLLSRKFIYWFLRQDSVREYANTIASGSVQKDLNHSAFKGIPIDVPPLAMQLKIASIFDALEARVTLLHETNATLEAMAQALFKSWFVDFDPVHANAGTRAATLPPELQTLFPATFTETPQGSVPEGWKWGTIADFADLNPESWTAKKHPATVAYIDLANAKDNVIADIAEFDFDAAPSRARRVLRDGDTIVGTVRPGNRSFAFIQDAADNLTGSTGFAVLRPKHQRNTAFIYLTATNDNSIDHLTHVADGGAYPAVRPEVVANLSCICPPTEVLEAFNSVAAELLIKVAKNHLQAQTLATLRDTLLPRLISGQFRLPEAEAALAEVSLC